MVKSKIDKSNKSLSKKVVLKRVLKKTEVGVTIPNFKAPSILGEKNRFFKEEEGDAEMQMFFK